MKQKPVVILPTLLFLLSSVAAAEPVLDTGGKELTSNVVYHILPSPGSLDGLCLRRRDAACPLYVAKEKAEAMLLTPYDAGEGTVMLGADTKLSSFRAPSACEPPSRIWDLGAADPITRRNYVVIAGGGRTPQLGSRFRIGRFPGKASYYKLGFCPQGGALCGDLGLFVENGKAWLGFGGSPFPVVFQSVG